ncbi:MAG: sodium:proton antiporter [Candidatus Ancillula sp.]|jgi:CPA1 family monovalent cation:H+ antiporter|nr:sodium:proton antiporter [Candidatus Ancillula sp.]
MVIEVLIIAFLGLILTSVAKKIHFSSELLLVIVCGAISFLPFVPEIEVEGHLLLMIILPPLLFSAARNLSGYKFKKMKNPIIWLGFGLIFITALSVAFFVNLTVGFMTFGAGLILGAVVAPPDAVSSVSIGKKLGLPDRVMTILTGESLINDAAALTLFSFAVAVTYRQDAVFEHPAILLAWTSVVGILVGVVFGAVCVIARKLLNDANIVAVFTALSPWGIYIIAEHLLASGVLAVVVAGFIIEKGNLKSSHTTRLQEKSLWHSIETLLDSFVFCYIGLQLHTIVFQLVESELDVLSTILYGCAVFLTIILVRPIGVLGFNATRIIWYRMQYRHLSHFVRSSSRNRQINTKARDNLIDAPISWREYLILSWTGMRGVVTLATASSVPFAFGDDPIDYSSDAFKIHVFIQVAGVVVTFGTLLLQGLTLPILIKLLLGEKRNEIDPLAGQWRKAREIVDDAAIRIIEDEYAADPSFDKNHLLNVYKSLDAATIAKDKRDISFISGMFSAIVEAQREDILRASETGDLHTDVAREFINRLDLRLASFTS